MIRQKYREEFEQIGVDDLRKRVAASTFDAEKLQYARAHAALQWSKSDTWYRSDEVIGRDISTLQPDSTVWFAPLVAEQNLHFRNAKMEGQENLNPSEMASDCQMTARRAKLPQILTEYARWPLICINADCAFNNYSQFHCLIMSMEQTNDGERRSRSGRRRNSGFDEAGRQQTSWLGFYAHNMVGIQGDRLWLQGTEGGNDDQLDRLLAAVLAERQARGGKKLPVSVETSRKPRVKEVAPPLAQGKLNAVRAAFKAGVTPSRIARQFGISQSDVRKALAKDSSK